MTERKGADDGDGGDKRNDKQAWAKKEKEIEGLLRHGAQKLFTEEHDAQIDNFNTESIEQILKERTTSRLVEADERSGQRSSTFAKAAFGVDEGEAAGPSLDDDKFWEKVLGEDEKGGGGEEGGLDKSGARHRGRRITHRAKRAATEKQPAGAEDTVEDGVWTRASSSSSARRSSARATPRCPPPSAATRSTARSPASAPTRWWRR